VLHRLPLLTLFLVLTAPADAAADWLIAPFVGMKFGGETTLFDPDKGVGLRKFIFGASSGFLTDGIIGLEADFAFVPRYFDRAGNPASQGSSVLTLMGDVIVAVPAAVSRDGLRPYILGGVGWMRANIDTAAAPGMAEGVADNTSNMFAMNVGGGAMGRLTNRSSVRFELRHFKNLTHPPADFALGRTQLSFWRVTVGVAIRY
jgi:opacity protein-like surface antigen